MDRYFTLFVSILRFPDGTWHIYSPDLDTEHQVGANLKGDKDAIANVLIPDITAGKLQSMPPVDRILMRKLTINWLLANGYDWDVTLIDYESVRFRCIKNGNK